jgi:CheY-like chemotaxis protein
VLSVDDDHVNQTVMQSLLGSAGYDLITAGSGQVGTEEGSGTRDAFESLSPMDRVNLDCCCAQPLR